MSFLDCPTCRSIGGLCADHLASMSAPYPPTLLESLIGGRPQQSSLSGPGPYLQNDLSGPGPGIANKPTEIERLILREIGYRTMPAPDVVAMEYRNLWLTALQVQGTPIRWYHRLWWRVKRWLP